MHKKERGRNLILVDFPWLRSAAFATLFINLSRTLKTHNCSFLFVFGFFPQSGAVNFCFFFVLFFYPFYSLMSMWPSVVAALRCDVISIPLFCNFVLTDYMKGKKRAILGKEGKLFFLMLNLQSRLANLNGLTSLIFHTVS